MQGPAFGPFEPLGHVMNPETVRNEDLMEHWNQTVAPGDTVYVGGDFGSEEWKPFLNGTIIQK
jgi:calcineurin-like phosphoesterase family protein